MDIRTEVREIEKHVINLDTLSKQQKIKIISRAQSLAGTNERAIAVLAIVKNRIIHAKDTNDK